MLEIIYELIYLFFVSVVVSIAFQGHYSEMLKSLVGVEFLSQMLPDLSLATCVRKVLSLAKNEGVKNNYMHFSTECYRIPLEINLSNTDFVVAVLIHIYTVEQTLFFFSFFPKLNSCKNVDLYKYH